MSAPQPPRCALARIQIEQVDVEEVKREGWSKHGILVVRADDPRLRWIEQKVIADLGNRLYGKGRKI